MLQANPDAQARFEACLTALRQLKELSARREVVEREILLALLLANREHLSEFPATEGDQQNLVNTLTTRCDTLPGHEFLRDWLVDFVARLNQYEVAKRTGAQDQTPELESALLLGEALLVKCLQGYIFVSGVIRDELSDAVLRRFGEDALPRIDELTSAGEADARFWRGFFDTFLFDFVAKAYDEVMAAEQYRLTREGSFLALRVSLDALTARLPGTGGKTIDKTRLQTAFEHAQTSFEGRQAAVYATGVIAGLPAPLLQERYLKSDGEFLGRMAAMDPVTARANAVLAQGHPLDPEEQADPAQAKAFLKDQVVALCVGGSMALGISREDLSRTLRGFSPRELDAVFTAAGAFQPVAMRHAYQIMLEQALLAYMSAKAGDDAGKVQVRLFKHRRAPRQTVEALAPDGLNRIRQKLYFDDDPTASGWLLFKAKTVQDLAEALRFSNMEPKLVTAVQRLWSARQFRAEAVALVNLPLVAKSSPNLQARLSEILARFGVVKSG